MENEECRRNAYLDAKEYNSRRKKLFIEQGTGDWRKCLFIGWEDDKYLMLDGDRHLTFTGNGKVNVATLIDGELVLSLEPIFDLKRKPSIVACRFCESKNVTLKCANLIWFVECPDCHASGPASKSPYYAARYWNNGK